MMGAFPDRSYEQSSAARSLYPLEPRAVSFVDHEVLAEASHELKTPLSSIQNSLTLLKLGASGPIPEDALQVLEVVERNTTRMMALIEEILFAQRATLVFEQVKVDSLVKNAVEVISGELIEKNIVVEYQPSNLVVLGDEKKLVQVLVNLLSNAVKFSPAYGIITIHAQAQNSRAVIITVSDEGQGVPESDLERIFLKHEQGVTHRERGSGLGLAIAKRIVETHGGQIGIYNRSGNKCGDKGGDKGATFWIRLKQVAKSAEISSNSPISADGKVA